MPTENELRTLLRNAETPTSDIDPATIIRRSKRRRLPAQIGVGSVTTLALAGIGIAGFSGIRPLGHSISSSEVLKSSDAPAQAPGDHGLFSDDALPPSADKLSSCGATVAEGVPSATGLKLIAHFPLTAPATGEPVSGTVRLTNASAEPISGTTASVPAITISQDGVALWHSDGPMVPVAVELAAGESMDYRASFTPVRCDIEAGFRDDLPALDPGVYQVSAVIELSRRDGSTELVTGPVSSVTLR